MTRLLPVALMLAGCSTAGNISGLVAGGVAGGATANPAVGYAVGVAVKVAATATLRYADRVRQHAEQDAIAAAAGPLAEGSAAPWKIRHDIPFGDEHGQVVVVRAIDNPVADCREIAFSVHEDPPAPDAWFATTICKAVARLDLGAGRTGRRAVGLPAASIGCGRMVGATGIEPVTPTVSR